VKTAAPQVTLTEPRAAGLVRVSVYSAVRMMSDGVRQLLADESGILASSASSLRDLGDESEFDVVLIDGETVSPQELDPNPPLDRGMLVFGLRPGSGAKALAWIRAGANAFLPATATPRQLADAIRAVHKNELLIPPAIAFSAIREATRSSDLQTPAMPKLTPRQAEVTALLERGLTNREIAQELDLTLSTVKNHVHSLLQKLQTPGRREVAAAMRATRKARQTSIPIDGMGYPGADGSSREAP
jgi:two-component system nitrate/nitrite response regulator NarL